MEINLNDLVEVTLTEVGAEVWRDHQEKCGFVADDKKAGDSMRLQLWSVASVFGGAMRIGFDPPIHTAIEVCNAEATTDSV